MTTLDEFLLEQKTEFIKKYVEEYKDKKIRLAKLLRYLKPILIQLKKQNYNVIEMKEFIENSFKIKVNYNPFWKWCKRNLKGINSNDFDDVIIKNDTQKTTPKVVEKVVERETPKVVEKVVEKPTKKEVEKDVETTQKNDKNDSASSSSITKEKLDKLANTDIDINQFL